MQTVVGLLIILLGIGLSMYLVKKAEKRVAEMPKQEPFRPVTIEEAVTALDEMRQSDPSARRYVELYGLARTDNSVKAPFTQRPAAYYASRSYAVRDREKPEQTRQKWVLSKTATEQRELYSESGPEDFYILDSTSDEKIYVDMKEFRENVELVSVCDSYEDRNSKWVERHKMDCPHFFPVCDWKITGYHLLESFYRPDQPLYVVGELYRRGRDYHVAPSSKQGRRSVVTYRSEEQAARVLQKARQSAMGLGLILVAVGFGVMIAGFR